jgi:hypothetical protein
MPAQIQKHRYPVTGRILFVVWLLQLFVFAADSFAGTEPEYIIKISGHQFVPAELHIPTGIKVRIVLDNQDDTAEEFDSHSLNREKHVPPKSQATIFIGPLAPGRYIYEGESEVAGGPALGVIVVE